MMSTPTFAAWAQARTASGAADPLAYGPHALASGTRARNLGAKCVSTVSSTFSIPWTSASVSLAARRHSARPGGIGFGEGDELLDPEQPMSAPSATATAIVNLMPPTSVAVSSDTVIPLRSPN